jgi:hypothetical protein
MLHIITSPSFTEYSQERLGSKVARRREEPETSVAPWGPYSAPEPTAPRFVRAFSASLDGVRRLFGSAPKVRHS